MNKKRLTALYIFFDILASIITWICFYFYRKHIGEHLDISGILQAVGHDPKFFWGLLLCPLYWIFLHALAGYYNKIYRKSRLSELGTTIATTFIGALVFFFAFILDGDEVGNIAIIIFTCRLDLPPRGDNCPVNS